MTPRSWISVTITLALTLVMVYMAGYFNNHLHFQDDHEIVTMVSQLAKQDIVQVIKFWIKKDSENRFRPLYYVHRVVEAKVFGLNLKLWRLYVIGLFFITFILTQKVLEHVTGDFLLALCGSLMTFIGDQTQVYWMLGPNEQLGMLLFVLCCYLITHGSGSILVNCLIGLTILLLGFSKESFLISIPALLLWQWISFSTQTISSRIWKSLPAWIGSTIVFGSAIYFAVNKGLNNNTYAGVDSSPLKVLSGIPYIFIYGIKSYTLLFCAVLTIFFVNFRYMDVLRHLRSDFRYHMVAILIIIPNLLVYSKSGMYYRYILPSSFAIALTIVLMLKHINIRNVSQLVKILVVIGFISYQSYLTISGFSEYRRSGVATTSFIHDLSTMTKNEDIPVIIIDPAANYEASFALQIFMNEIYHRSIQFFKDSNLTVRTDADVVLHNSWDSHHAKRLVHNLVNENVIGCLNKKAMNNVRDLDKYTIHSYDSTLFLLIKK